MTMEKHNLIILSTAHLHPLEAAKIDEFAYVGNKECALVSTTPEMRDFYYQGGLVCLCDLLKEVQEKHNADYVLFDPDANTTDGFKYYNW
jgi:hypothetical protein